MQKALYPLSSQFRSGLLQTLVKEPLGAEISVKAKDSPPPHTKNAQIYIYTILPTMSEVSEKGKSSPTHGLKLGATIVPGKPLCELMSITIPNLGLPTKPLMFMLWP